MINDAEIKRQAAKLAVDPMIIDLDYALGWFLCSLSKSTNFYGGMVFKGGTCLRKCYFENYRFSEDLDFTDIKHISESQLKEYIHTAIEWSRDNNGPDFSIEPSRFEIINDEYGKNSFQIRIYYRGPLYYTGSPRTIKLDITQHEKVMSPSERRLTIHPYSDKKILRNEKIPCYSLEEMLAEKIRALSGQRRYAISRDIFDIYYILKAGVDLNQVKIILPDKFEIKGLSASDINEKYLKNRKKDFNLDWQKSLSNLVINKEINFIDAWEKVVSLEKNIK